MNRQLKVLGLSKGSYYYKSKETSAVDLDLCGRIDREHTEHPAKGVRQMRLFLLQLGIATGVKRVRRLMRAMGIEAHYPKPNLSKLGRAKHVHPYLLRNLKVTRPHQVWSTDITYIAMPSGHAYLYAIIDVYTRVIVGWGLYTTLEAKNAIDVLDKAIAEYGLPEIINSDQGSQYTCRQWIESLKDRGVTISMDGRGRCRDNAWIERFWHTLKMEYVYLHPHTTVTDMRRGIGWFIDYYNNRRPHSAIDDMTPKEYLTRAMAAAA